MVWTLIKQFKLMLFTAILASIIAGTGNVLLITTMNSALSLGQAREILVVDFMIAASLAVIGRVGSGMLFHRLSQSVLLQLRLLIARRVLAADYRSLEIVGSAKINTALTEESAQVSVLMVSLPAVTTNLVIVFGILICLAALSWKIFVLAIAVIAVGAFGYHRLHLVALRFLHRAAETQVHLFEHFAALIGGAKELKLNKSKRDAFLTDLLGRSAETVRDERIAGLSWFTLSAGWGSLLIFSFIGCVIFLLTGNSAEEIKIATGFTLLLLYMITPLEVLLNNIPQINLACVAARRIAQTLDALPAGLSPEENTAPACIDHPFDRLSLQDVIYAYDSTNGDHFTVGPFTLSFERGELVFLVGGNGSGKTTFAKLLTGLYVPTAGEILLNGITITPANRDGYRQFFTAIFSDFHLFDRLIGISHPDPDHYGNKLIERFDLQHKLTITSGTFSTLDLSQGQRKRLALVTMLLEDRPFLVFDEWAADQDPLYREIFYKEILPSLKQQGKTILVISHDDRYFHLADRVIHMSDGRIDKDTSAKTAVLPINTLSKPAVCPAAGA